MKKIFSLLLVVMMLLCGTAMAEEPYYNGTWELTAATVEGVTYTAAELQLVMTLSLCDEGVCNLFDNGVPATCSWSFSGDTVTVTSSAGNDMVLTHADGKLSGMVNGVHMEFAPAMMGGWVLFSAMDAQGNVYTAEQMGVNASMTFFEENRVIMTDDESTELAGWAMNGEYVVIATEDDSIVYFGYTIVDNGDGTFTEVLATAKDDIYLYFVAVPQ